MIGYRLFQITAVIFKFEGLFFSLFNTSFCGSVLFSFSIQIAIMSIGKIFMVLVTLLFVTILGLFYYESTYTRFEIMRSIAFLA